MAFNRLHLIRQVDLFSLKLFLSAAEEGQIGRAAIRENISASTATKRIQDLEEIAGVKLFDRAPAGVVPTTAGQVLERYLRKIFAHLDDMRTEISAFTDGVRGEIVVASARSIIAPLLAKELGDFNREFPMVEIIVQDMENVRIVQAVVSGEAEIGIFAAAPNIDLSGVDIAPYREDRMVAVVPVGHRLANREIVTFADLLPEKIIPVTALVNMFENAASRLKQTFTPRYVVRSSGVAVSLVQAGLGVTVQPEYIVNRYVQENDVVVVQLDEAWATRQLMIATPENRVVSRATAALKRQLLDRPGELSKNSHS